MIFFFFSMCWSGDAYLRLPSHHATCLEICVSRCSNNDIRPHYITRTRSMKTSMMSSVTSRRLAQGLRRRPVLLPRLRPSPLTTASPQHWRSTFYVHPTHMRQYVRTIRHPEVSRIRSWCAITALALVPCRMHSWPATYRP